MKKPQRAYLTELKQPPVLGSLASFPHDPLSNKGVVALRKYAKPERVIKSQNTDFKKALAIARFTSEAWTHDGYNSNPKKKDALTILKHAAKGASFSCVQFGSVFTQLCHSVGIPARVLQVQTRSPDLGTSGHGHITAEYFDSELAKWVWVDPQIHAYAVYRGKPLSFNEFAELVVAGKKPTIKYSSRTLKYLNYDRKGFKVLHDFLRRYVWTTRVGGFNAYYTKQKSVQEVGCHRTGVLPAITFQGFADKMPRYVSREVFDAPLNACQVRFETFRPSKVMELKDLKDYKENAWKNYVTQKIQVNLNHSMPWFDHYVVIFNGKRSRTKKPVLKLNLKKGRNLLEIYPVNSMKREGVSTKAVIHFDNKYKNVKNFW
jgi:hypothetical protein